MTHHKIALAKDETLKDAAGSIAVEDAKEIVITIPKGSALLEEAGAFKKLKKTAEAMGKAISVESVDDAVLAAAKAAGIAAANPFFTGAGPVAWGDESSRDEDEGAAGDEADEDGGIAPPVVATPVVHRARPIPKAAYRRAVRVDDDDEEDLGRARSPRSRRRLWVIAGAALVLLIPAYWVAFSALPRAEITIETKKQEWKFNNLLAIQRNGTVPAVMISEKKNAQMVFPATGKKQMSQKATGKIVVYNAYNSSPQQLVATTRFMTESGKIVRLAKSITIPGARVQDGKITPSSIEAEVVADKPGADYNLGPSGRLSIPGFKGSLKYEGFYGEIQKPLTGGFIGEAPYPTESDIAAAKTKITAVLTESLAAQAAVAAEGKYVIPEGARTVSLTKFEASPSVNGKGEFTVFAEGEFKALGFKESDLIGYFAAQMKEELGPEYSFKETELAYDVPKIDFAKGSMSLPIDFTGVAEIPVTLADLRSQVPGKSEPELKELLLGVPGVQSAVVTLWPAYVRRVPAGRPERITFVVK
jgi:hypothetical protein